MKTTNTLTKKERRTNDLERHYKALDNLAKICGIKEPNGKKLSVKLLNLERQAHKLSLAYCNGVIQMEEWEEKTDYILHEVNTLFDNRLNGFFINGDARGYALKIQDSVMRSEYNETRLQTDWGGYGLLAPEIS